MSEQVGCSKCGDIVEEYMNMYGWTNTHGPSDGDGERTGPFPTCRKCFHKAMKSFGGYDEAETNKRFDSMKGVYE